MTLLAHAESRRRNLGRVLRLLHEQGALRQADISERLGVSRSTGISLVEELTDLGLAVELEGEPVRQRGRPSRLIAPSPEVVVVVAEIAAESARVDIVALGDTVLVGVDVAISPSTLGPSRTLRRIATTAKRLLADRPTLRVIGAALAIHGAVDTERRIVFAPNLGWEGADAGAVDALIRAALPDQDVPPALVGNDADLGALGERRRGAGRNHRDFLYLSAERGVGGGLVLDGKVALGGSGLAGEVGHMKVGASEHACNCGQHGCWETEIGTAAIERAGEVEAADEVLVRAEEGAADALGVVDGIGGWMGRGLGLLIPILQPDAVVVGGHLARVVALARPAIDEAIASACPSQLTSGLDILPSELGKDAALIGAAELAFEALLEDPASVGRRG